MDFQREILDAKCDNKKVNAGDDLPTVVHTVEREYKVETAIF